VEASNLELKEGPTHTLCYWKIYQGGSDRAIHSRPLSSQGSGEQEM